MSTPSDRDLRPDALIDDDDPIVSIEQIRALLGLSDTWQKRPGYVLEDVEIEFLIQLLTHPGRESIDTSTMLRYLLPERSPEDHRRLIEIVGEEGAVAIAEGLGRVKITEYYRNHGKARERLQSAITAAEQLQELRLDGMDFRQWGLEEHVWGLGSSINGVIQELVRVLKSAPLLHRPPGRPSNRTRKALAVGVAEWLQSAGVAVSTDPAGPLSEVLEMLLGMKSPDRLVRHAARIVGAARVRGKNVQQG